MELGCCIASFPHGFEPTGFSAELSVLIYCVLPPVLGRSPQVGVSPEERHTSKRGEKRCV